MRADRLLSIVYLLKANGMMSAPELARALEVSARTILRDVESLSAAGVPVYSQPGRGGGIGLVPGYRTDVSALSEQEATALFAAIASPGADALGLGDALASALRKIMAALPDAHRPAAARLAERVVIDTGGWLPRAEEPLLELAQQAVLTDRRLRIGYQGRADHSPSTRTIDPYGLLHSGGVWYLVAGYRRQPRFYRLARVTTMRILDEQATRPPDLDLREPWARRREGFRSAFTPLTVEFWLRRAKLGDLTGRSAGPLEPADTDGWPAPPDPWEHWAPIRTVFGDLSHAWLVLRELGVDAIVINPRPLRERIVAQARAVLTAYDDGPAGDAGDAGTEHPGSLAD